MLLHNDMSDKEVGQQVDGETSLAYEYFKVYRDTTPDERSLERLRDHEVSGKKRTPTVFKRWSVNHNWQRRVRDWDVERSKDTLRAVILQRNRELVDFINRDFAIAKVAQGLAQKKLVELNGQESLDALEYRQVMMGYREAREFLKELIGIFEGQTDILNRVTT